MFLQKLGMLRNRYLKQRKDRLISLVTFGNRGLLELLVRDLNGMYSFLEKVKRIWDGQVGMVLI